MNGIFDPKGPIAGDERTLIITMALLMLIVVIPMFVALFTIARKYRAGNPKATAADYQPERKHGAWSELVLWAIPAVLIAILAVFTWRSAHALDPYTAISGAPIEIQVVALPWKWLFIYPAQNIATVNFVEFPVGTPVHFELTADGPISSFWIPQLGTQIYAMAAMQTQLNTIASQTGDFVGKDTEINGAGYAGMTFVARSVSAGDFATWVAEVQATSTATSTAPTGCASLTLDAYNALAAPSENNPAAYYSSVTSGLFNNIMMKYMQPN